MASINRKALIIVLTILAALTVAVAAVAVWVSNKEARAKESIDEARLLASRGQYDAAILQYKNAIANAPADTVACLELSDIYVAQGDLGNAYRYARSAADKDPRSVEALSRLAWCYSLAGQWPDLRRAASVIITLAPGGRKEAQAHSYLAKAYYRDGDYQRACDEFARAVAMDEEDADSVLARALILSRHLSAPQEAEASIQKLAARMADDSLSSGQRANAATAAAKFYAAVGRPRDAEKFLKAAIEIDPHSASGHIALGDFYRRNGRDAKSLASAEEAYSKAAALDPAGCISLGILYRDTGRTDKAIAVFSQAVAAEKAPVFYQHLVEALIDRGDLNAAAQRVKEMRGVKNAENIIDYLQGRIALASAGAKADEVRKAEDLFADVSKRQPQFPHAHYYYGLCLAARGMLDEAGEQFRKTLELAPAYFDASAALAETYMRSYQLDKAAGQARSILDADANHYRANLILGRSLAAQGNFADAARFLQKAQSVRPSAADSYLALADLLAAQGNLDAAAKTLDEGARQVEDPGRLRMALALIYQLQNKDEDALAVAADLAGRTRTATTAAFYASLLWQHGRAEDAIEFLKEGAAQNGAEYLTLLGDFQRTMGQPAQALETYKRALALLPGDAKALSGAAAALVSLKRPAEAREALRLLRRAQPGSQAADMLEARLLESEGKNDAAAAILSNSIRQNPSNPENYYELAVVEAARGESARAVDNLKSALKYNPSYVAARLALAQFYYRSQFYEEALREAQRVARAQRTDSAALSKAAAIAAGSLVETGRIGEAITTWSQLPPEVSGTGDYQCKLGYLYLMNADYARAEESFRKAAGLLEDPSQAREGLARVFLAQSRYADAESAVKDALSGKSPSATRVRLLQLMANVKLLEGDADAAAKTLSDLMDICGNDAALLVQAGDSFHALGRTDDALAAYRKAAATDSSSIQARHRVIMSLVEAGNLKEAKNAADKVLKEHPSDLQSQLLTAQVLLVMDKPAEAARIATSALSTAPQGHDAAVAHYLLGAACYKQKKVSTAETELRHALAQDASMTQARVLLARTLVSGRAFEDAAVEAQRVIEQDAANAEAYAVLGDAASAAGDAKTAVERYRKAASLRRSASIVVLLAGALRDAGRTDEAVAELEAYRKTASPDAAVMNMLAEIYEGRKDYEAAEAVLKDAVSGNGADATTLRGLARVYKEQDKVAEAETLLKGALTNADFPDSYVLLAGLYDTRNMNEEAEETLRNGVKSRPDYLPNYEALALLVADAGRVDEAVSLLRKAAADNSQAEAFQRAIGRFYKRRNMVSECESFLKETASKYPKYADAVCDLGDLYLAKGDMAAATSAYERALRFSPESSRAANALAYALAERGADLPRAVELAQRAREKAPGDPNTQDTLGWAYYKYGQYDKAVANLTDAARLAGTSSPAILYHLALAYEKLGAQARARETAANLVSVDSSYKDRPDVKALLERK